jgi:hypothetical protein
LVRHAAISILGSACRPMRGSVGPRIPATMATITYGHSRFAIVATQLYFAHVVVLLLSLIEHSIQRIEVQTQQSSKKKNM